AGCSGGELRRVRRSDPRERPCVRCRRAPVRRHRDRRVAGVRAVSDAPPARLALEVAATPDDLMAAVTKLETFCREGGMREPEIYALMLALEETGANVIH